jgi:hypothetical protein
MAMNYDGPDFQKQHPKVGSHQISEWRNASCHCDRIHGYLFGKLFWSPTGGHSNNLEPLFLNNLSALEKNFEA